VVAYWVSSSFTLALMIALKNSRLVIISSFHTADRSPPIFIFKRGVPLLITYLLYHRCWGLSRGNFNFFEIFSDFRPRCKLNQQQVLSNRSLLTLSIITDFLKMSIPFSKKFEKIF
jgi:hypothetical protein